MNRTALRVRQPLTLEDRRLLAPVDLVSNGFGTSGVNLSITYDVTEATAPAFDIGIYAQGATGSPATLLMTHRVSIASERTVGQHTVNLQAAFNDLDTDYKLLARLDCSAEVSEEYEYNNERYFSGGTFQATDGTVFVHGTCGADTITVSNGSVTLNGTTKNFSSVTSLRVRAQDGNDTVYAGSGVTVPITAFGGAGSDTLTGGNVADSLFGGAGDDFLYGLGGNDSLQGEQGNDYLTGGYGDDLLWGGECIDVLVGGGQNDVIQDTPTITSFGASYNVNLWTFSGTVSDDGLLSGQLNFGGLLAGQTVTLNGNGTFTLVIALPPGTSGIVSVTWQDQESLVSSPESIYIA